MRSLFIVIKMLSKILFQLLDILITVNCVSLTQGTTDTCLKGRQNPSQGYYKLGIPKEKD